MKKHSILAVLLLASANILSAQNVVELQSTAPSTFGVGTSNPQGTLHIHTPIDIQFPNGTASPNYDESGIDFPTYNCTTTFHMTNDNTGMTINKGFVIRQFNKMVTLQQFESANFWLINGDGSIVLSPNGKIGIGGKNEGREKVYISGNTRIADTLTVSNAVSVQSSSGNLYMQVDSSIAEFHTPVSIGNGLKCDTEGNLSVKHLKVTMTGWPDYVFDSKPMPLDSVDAYISTYKHLPEVPSASEIEASGMDVGEMNRILMKKVEELTLYVIELNRQIEELKNQ